MEQETFLDTLFTLLGYWFPWLLFLGFILGLISWIWLRAKESLKHQKKGLFLKLALLSPRFFLLPERKPIYVVLDFFASLVWVFGLIFFIRSYLFEPFRIPSASMEPTLIPGDMILVSKFHYGFPAPLLRSYWHLEQSTFERGDVVVFRFPCAPEIKFIKRVVALPGDVLRFGVSSLTINGKKVPLSILSSNFPSSAKESLPLKHQKGKIIHSINLAFNPELIPETPYAPSCTREPHAIPTGEIVIPKGKIFVMGDNRFNSKDGRFWGFVDMNTVEGKANWVILNLNNIFSLNFKRTGRIL